VRGKQETHNLPSIRRIGRDEENASVTDAKGISISGRQRRDIATGD